jgi:2'-5' RNA ligase
MQSPGGKGQSSGDERTLSQFALVSYIPDTLARFLDDLRLELTPDCNPHAHVTILPPRPLCDDLNLAIQRITEESRSVAPFFVELSEIEVFDVSWVVYLGISRGSKELCELYTTLNCGPLEYKENFPYHPHITIAQNILAEDAQAMAAIARERWAQYQGPRGFLVSTLSLVQHVASSIWADVVSLPLGVEVSVAP